jgi:hypothetical protein
VQSGFPSSSLTSSLRGLLSVRATSVRARIRRVVIVAAAALAGCGIAIAGCGSSSSSDNGVAAKTPTQILTATKAAAEGASSVHVAGALVSGGVPLTLDLTLLAGKGGQGRISENGLSFEVITLNGKAYISGSPSFYTHFAGAAAAKLLEGKWLEGSTSSGSLASLAPLTELDKLLDSSLSTRGGTLSKGAKTSVSGQPAIALTESAQHGTLYVATTGKPYPIEITKSGAGGGTVSFDKWNQQVKLEAPKNVVNLSELQTGAHG